MKIQCIWGIVAFTAWTLCAAKAGDYFQEEQGIRAQIAKDQAELNKIKKTSRDAEASRNIDFIAGLLPDKKDAQLNTDAGTNYLFGRAQALQKEIDSLHKQLRTDFVAFVRDVDKAITLAEVREMNTHRPAVIAPFASTYSPYGKVGPCKPRINKPCKPTVQKPTCPKPCIMRH